MTINMIAISFPFSDKIILNFLDFIARNRMISQYLLWNSVTEVKDVIITFGSVFCITFVMICRLKKCHS